MDKMTSDWLNNIKTRLKRYPRFYRLLMDYVAPVHGNPKKTYRIVYDHLRDRSDRVVVNLGSGPFKLDNEIINVDMSRYSDVRVQADIHHLPFKDNSVDAIINIAVLEHVREPGRVIDESFRVLKTGGYIYSVVPFIVGFHASPGDYHRCTSEGIVYLHRRFQMVDVGVAGGPTSGFLWVLQEWLAILLSFGIRPLYKVLYLFFSVTLWPLKYLDIVLTRHPMADNIASSFYYLGKKE
jgi:Methylase involved in ubiquinone/menaquinone biosynthesis